MKKKGLKWLSVILAVAFVVSMIVPVSTGTRYVSAEESTVVETGECGDGLTWTFYSDGLLTITGTGTMDNWNPTSNIFQPWPYKDVIRVKIGVGVESIGSNAFCQCENLISVEIPATVEYIGAKAFQNCVLLETVKLPASVTAIGESAFAGCDVLKEINIPASVTAIGADAFKGCEKLPVVPGMVNGGEIKWYFEQATGAFTVKGYGDMPGYNPTENVYAPWNTYIDEIKSVTVGSGISSIGNFNFWWCPELVSVTLPATVTSIGNHAFQDCAKLESIALPKALEYIGAYAFCDCTKLPNLELPSTLTYIGEHAFYGCENIVEIPGIFGVNKEFRYYYNQETGAFRIEGQGVLPSYNPTYNSYAPWNVYRTGIKSISVPEGITTIGDHNFWWFKELVDASLPSTITRIGTGAFQDCDSLKTIELPDTITYIGERAFCNNLSLESLDLPKNLTTVGRASMSYNDALKSVKMYDNVTSMSNSVFEGDIALESVRLSEELTMIPTSTFEGCSSLESIDIPAKATYIGERAFYNCVKLSEVKGAEGVETINENAFYGCTSLETFDIPDTVTQIHEQVFYGCSKLKSIDIPDGVTKIYYNTFKDCTSLASVNLPDALTEIENSAFSNCTSLTSVQIPETVKTIGQYAFQNTNLSEVTIPASVTSVGKYAFVGNQNLKKVVILNPACKLDTAFAVAEGTVIHGYDGSTAEKYADLYEYEFVSLGKSDVSYFTPVVGSYSSTYTGNPIEPAITINGLVEGTDFKVTYSDNVNAGTATATITGIGDFTGTTSVTFNIRTKSVGYFTATLEYTEACYHPELKGPKVTIEGLTEGTDYTVKYAGDLMIDTVPVGKARAIVTGIGNYSGSTTLYYTVNATDITDLPGELDTTKVTFSNDGIKKPNVIIKYDKDSDLVLNKSYLKISYNPVSPSGVGTVQMTVTGQSPLYTGTKTFTYEIVPQSLTTLVDGASVYGGNYYTGEALTPSVMVKGDRYGNYLKEGTDYTLEYVNNVEPGTATVKITGIGNYCDTIEKNFYILLRDFDGYSIRASEPTVYYDGQPHSITVLGVPYFATVTYALSESGPYSEVKPTITEPGTLTVYYKVSAVGYEDRMGSGKVTIIDNPHTHVFENYVSDGNATCETDGTKTSKCNECSLTNTITDVGSALGHAWDAGVVDEDAQTTTYTCLNGCGKTKIVPIGTPATEEVARVYGGNRYKTSLAIADTYKDAIGVGEFNNVIVASGANFPDALAGSYLSAELNAPILMVNESNVGMIKSYIKENLKAGGNVYLLGGTGAVPTSMESGLEGYNVERLKGRNRYDTNLAILDKVGVTNETILVCTGTNFADSLSGSATGLPILLVNPAADTLTEDQKTFLEGTNSDIVIIGGEGAVSKAYADALLTYDKDNHVERLSGKGRHQTSVKVAERFFDNPYEAVIASATDFPDGLCGGPLAYAKGVPLVLTGPTVDVAADYMHKNGITSGIALGGSKALSEAGIKAVFGMGTEDEIQDEKYN